MAALVDAAVTAAGQEACEKLSGEAVTVEELMQLLAKRSPCPHVVMNGYEDGYDGLVPEQIGPVKMP